VRGLSEAVTVELHAAGGWQAAMLAEDETGILVSPLVCWARQSDGEIVGVVACGTETHLLNEFSNFLGYVPPGGDADDLYRDKAARWAAKHAQLDGRA
jgi:hypothetical protein